MKSGKRLSDPERKKLAGSFNITLDRNTTSIVSLPANLPIMPDWLPDHAKLVWENDLHRVIATGATEVDSGMFALYCVTMADFILSIEKGNPSNAAFRSELRKHLELLGIAGAKSRLAKIASGDPTKANPFTVRR